MLIFEDLHWLDSETQALLASLVDGLPAARMVLLVNYRPEYRHEWGSKTYYTQVRVDPLAAEGVHELLASVLGDDASLASVSATLMARTAGNPFFLEESIRTLVETGTLVGERGAYRLARPVDALRVPATVQAMLAARIDRLAPEDKRLLQTASVVGKDVPYGLLGEIADLPRRRAARRASPALQAAEFVYETALFPELEYTFKHALTHEVAYGSLLQDRRREVHGRRGRGDRAAVPRPTGRAPGAAGAPRHAGRGLGARPSPTRGQAGLKAEARSAYREAQTWIQESCAATSRLPEHRQTRELAVDVRFRIGRVFETLGEDRLLLDQYETAATIARALGDDGRLSRIYALMVRRSGQAGRSRPRHRGWPTCAPDGEGRRGHVAPGVHHVPSGHAPIGIGAISGGPLMTTDRSSSRRESRVLAGLVWRTTTHRWVSALSWPGR